MFLIEENVGEGAVEIHAAAGMQEATVLAEQLAKTSGRPVRVYVLHSEYEVETKIKRTDHIRTGSA